MRVVIAPDSFKGSASAGEAARAIAGGWLDVRPSDTVVLMPMADGGEGTMEAIQRSLLGSSRVPVTVTGPVPGADSVETTWLRVPGPDGDVGIVELAATSGLPLLDTLDPLHAHTVGFGDAIDSALEAGVHSLVVALGGSASTDGGLGMLLALGAVALDSHGEPVKPGNAGLASIVSLDLSGLAALPAGGVSVLTDVTSPLLGRRGAALVFGEQKGADEATRAEMDGNLARWADLLPAVDPAQPGAGAAGGTGFGLLAWGARITPGAPGVAGRIGLADRIADADLVITGEGRFDSQSAEGKVPHFVSALATRAGVRSFLVAGSIEAETADFAAAVSLTSVAGSAREAIAKPVQYLRLAAMELASSL